MSRLIEPGRSASKETLEDVATSISALSDQTPSHNPTVERTAIGIRLLAANV